MFSATSTHPRRVIAFIDIENLTGAPTFTDDDCTNVRDAITNYLDGIAPDTQVVAACSHYAARGVFTWSAARKVFRSGSDGADLALLDEMDLEFLPTRFTDVVIASGDGIFAERAAALASRGVRVHVISRRAALSRKLELAAGVVHTLGDIVIPAEEAAIA